jgi:hypothetical protein
LKRRQRARWAPWGVALILSALACESTYYDEYRAGHPDFEAGAPRDGASLEELLAGLYAPIPVETIEVKVSHLEIMQVDRDPWVGVRFDAVRRGAWVSSDEVSYAVLVTWECRFDAGLAEEGGVRMAYYLLPNNRLDARDHYVFRDRCAATNEFIAARGALIGVEREAVRRTAIRGGATKLGLTQAYRRGLAYVEAGRLEEASAMLVVGERSYRAATAALKVGRPAPEAIVEASRLRFNLMRALGVEAK